MNGHSSVPTIAGVLLFLASATAAHGQPAPPATRDIAVDEKPGQAIATDLAFVDELGQPVGLAQLIDGQQPIVLVMAYVRCDALCSLVLRGVADAVRQSKLDLGRDYRILTVSIDPREAAADSASLRAALMDLAGQDDPSGWRYLTGEEPAIRALADSIGFRYRWDDRTEQYAHPAVATVLSPDGRISRYLYGIRFTGEEFDAAIAGAGSGQVFESADNEAQPLSCFRFDPSLRAHWSAVASYFAIGGVVLILLVGGGIAYLARKERRHS